MTELLCQLPARTVLRLGRGTISQARIFCRKYASSAEIRRYDSERVPKVHQETISGRVHALKDAKPFSSFLTDTFNRQHDYLRISITERCNLRCLYCMPAEGVQLSPKQHLLTHHEILYLSALFVSQGVTKIRLTGGEPTIHPHIMPMLRDVGALKTRGLKELALTTNGLTLPRKIDDMVKAGVTGINLSLDTLDPFQFEIMTRRKGFDQVMKSIDKILELRTHGAPIKLKVNAVIIRGLNDHQVLPFTQMTQDKDIEVRFIEYMPFDGNRWSTGKMLSYQEMLAAIRERYPTLAKVEDHPNDTSKTYQIPGFTGRIGFITSMTEHFCGTCNRLRITSDGNLKVCLFGNTEVSLRDLMRNSFNGGEPIDEAAWEAVRQVEMDRLEGRVTGNPGLEAKEQELLDIIGMAVKRKKAQHAGIGQLENMKNRPMILIDPRSKPRLPFAVASNGPIILSKMYPVHNSPQFARPFVSFSTMTKLEIADNESSAPKSQLTHLTPSGSAQMVHLPPPSRPESLVSKTSRQIKPPTARLAVARSIIAFSNPTPLALIQSAGLKKGDALSVARIAGIMAAKQTATLIPLCHNIPLSGVNVEVDTVEAGALAPSFLLAQESSGDRLEGDTSSEGQGMREPVGEFGGIVITARVHTYGQTGVEMEALTAATVAALTVYDMCKATDKGMRMEAVRVCLKEGGKSGRLVEKSKR